MGLALGIALYVMIWWTTLFAVLPIGIKTQGEMGEVVEGTPASAPAKIHFKRVILLNTLVATAAFAIVWVALDRDWLYPNIPKSMIAPEAH